MRGVPKGASGCQRNPLGSGKERFGRCSRLLKADDFKTVFSRPRKSVDDCFTVLACANTQKHPRLGLAIAKRQVRSAVARNRIKRVIRESFRRHQSLLPALDIVVLARRGTEAKGNAELFRSLQGHWSRLGRRCAG